MWSHRLEPPTLRRLGALIAWAALATSQGAAHSTTPAHEVPPAAASATGSDLSALIVDAGLGLLPTVDALDAALAVAAPSAVIGFETARAAALRAAQDGEAKNALFQLGELVAGFPARTLALIGARDLPVAERVARLDVAFAIARHDARPPIVDVATALAMARLETPDGAREAKRQLQEVLEAVLLEDQREARHALRFAFPRAARELEAAFVDALRAELEAPRLVTLAELLGTKDGADGVILNRIHGLALRLGPVLEETELRRIRACMRSSVPFERTGAAFALGALEDRDSVDSLVSALRDPDTSVRNAAHDALRQISAMTIGPSHDRWSAWHARERAWWSERGAAELARVGSADRAEVLRVLREATHHRLFREEITASVAPLLYSDDTTIVRMALATLEAVRARQVELEIVDLLEHSSSTIRAQAATCLRNLTGRMLPADPLVWRQVLQP